MKRELIGNSASLIDDSSVVGIVLPDELERALRQLLDQTEGAVWDPNMFDEQGELRENLAARERSSGRIAAQHVRHLSKRGLTALEHGDLLQACRYYVSSSSDYISSISDPRKLMVVPPPPHRPDLDPEKCRRLYMAAEEIRRASTKRVGKAKACSLAIEKDPTLGPKAASTRTLERMFDKGRDAVISSLPA